MFNNRMAIIAAGLASAASFIGGRIHSGISIPEAYRTVKPVTEKNIGRNWLKYGNGKYRPHQGEREKARRRRQLAAGQIHFIQHGPAVRGQS